MTTKNNTHTNSNTQPATQKEIPIVVVEPQQQKPSSTTQTPANTNNTNNTQKTVTKTVQPDTSIKTNHQNTALGSTGLGLILAVILGLFAKGGWNFWQKKKGKIYTKNLLDDLEKEWSRLKEDFMDKKQDILFDTSLTPDKKVEKLNQVKKEYDDKFDKLDTKKEDLKNKLKGRRV